MTLRAIREELATVVVEATSGFVVYDHDSPSPELPAIVVTRYEPISFQGGTADQSLRFKMAIEFRFGIADAEVSSKAADDACSSAIPAALAAHTGVAWKSANPISINPPELFADQGIVATALIVDMHAPIT